MRSVPRTLALGCHLPGDLGDKEQIVNSRLLPAPLTRMAGCGGRPGVPTSASLSDPPLGLGRFLELGFLWLLGQARGGLGHIADQG